LHDSGKAQGQKTTQKVQKVRKQMHRKLHTHSVENEGNLIRWASHYDILVKALTLGHAPMLRRTTIELAQIQRGERVLDVGCGTGDLTQLAKAEAGNTGEVWGVDASPEMIAVARQKAAAREITIDYRVEMIQALPFADNSFDVVVSSLMMHHLPAPVQERGLHQLHRVLRPNGRLLIMDFRTPTSHIGKLLLSLTMHGMIDAKFEELPLRLEAAGFHALEVGKLTMLPLGYIKATVNKG
jgi:demethylmenaquinone methyltransferase/2-methoxy-6-polyprenyl-1,4-benzoquinol methylase/phosphoethanolamine N-methyltransferase